MSANNEKLVDALLPCPHCGKVPVVETVYEDLNFLT